MFNRKTHRPNNGIVEAAHPAVAGFLADTGQEIADTFEPVVHSALDHWVSISILFAVACAIFVARAFGVLQ